MNYPLDTLKIFKDCFLIELYFDKLPFKTATKEQLLMSLSTTLANIEIEQLRVQYLSLSSYFLSASHCSLLLPFFNHLVQEIKVLGPRLEPPSSRANVQKVDTLTHRAMVPCSSTLHLKG